MPIYEYRCNLCNQDFERLEKISAEPDPTCDLCGKEGASRLISAAGFQLKGTGWYATDFKNAGKAPKTNEKSESAKPASEPSSKSSGQKTESN